MRRRYQKKFDSSLLIFLVAALVGFSILGGIPVKLPDMSLAFSIVIIIVLAGLAIAVVVICGTFIYDRITERDRTRNFAALRAHAVDSMTGTEFEIFLKHLLTARGFTVKGIWHGNDGGVDLVAKLGDKIYSIQAKRHSSRNKPGRRAITDAVAGITYRKCTHAMAITNSYFTKAAIEYARKTGCELVDRDVLAEWIYELQDK